MNAFAAGYHLGRAIGRRRRRCSVRRGGPCLRVNKYTAGGLGFCTFSNLTRANRATYKLAAASSSQTLFNQTPSTLVIAAV